MVFLVLRWCSVVVWIYQHLHLYYNCACMVFFFVLRNLMLVLKVLAPNVYFSWTSAGTSVRPCLHVMFLCTVRSYWHCSLPWHLCIEFWKNICCNRKQGQQCKLISLHLVGSRGKGLGGELLCHLDIICVYIVSRLLVCIDKVKHSFASKKKVAVCGVIYS